MRTNLRSERAGDRAAQRRLADAGRSDEAEDRALHLLAAQLAHGQVLEDALLDLLEVVVVLVEDLARAGEVVVVRRHHAPRQAGHPVEIGADDRRLGGVGMRALEALDLLLDLLPRLRRDLLLFDLLAVVLDLLGELFAFAELRLDRLELLAQEVLALATCSSRPAPAEEISCCMVSRLISRVSSSLTFFRRSTRIDRLEDRPAPLRA